MSENSGTTFAVYNPDLLSDADLKRQFVARLGLLQRLTDDLEGSGTPQHHLIIGQRGMGKTTLLRRLRGVIQENDALRERWLPLSFPEEQYNVARLSDLWVNCLDALGDALERDGDEAGATGLDALVDGLPAEEEARGRLALDGLLAWAEQHRGLVLMIDNVDLLLDRLAAHHWTLREVMSEHPRLVWVAASAQAIEATAEYGSAFYDFFAIHELRGLDYEESRQVLIRLAQVHDWPQVVRLLDETAGRFRALHVLTGGNPRTLVLLYQVFAHGDASTVHVDLERLLDMCTPLYKARFEALSAQAQQLTDALAIGWDPMSAAQVAATTRLEINLVSAQLNRLTGAGVVEKVPLPSGTRTGFQIAERFFNIWYLMRASRRVRRKLEWLVRFLEIFYGPEDLVRRAERLLDQRGGARDAELAFALSRSVLEPGLSRALASVAVDSLMQRERAGFRERLGEFFDLEGEDRGVGTLAERKAIHAEAEAAVLASPMDWTAAGCTAAEFWDLLAGSVSLDSAAKREIGVSIGTLRPDEIGHLLQLLRGESNKVIRLFGEEAALALRRSIRTGVMAGFDDVDGADAARRLFQCDSLSAIARLVHVDMHGGGSAEEIAGCEGWLSHCSAPVTWTTWGKVLVDYLARPEDAEQAYRRAIELDPRSARPWNGLGNLLTTQFGRYDEAERAFRTAIDVEPAESAPWNGLGNLLSDHLGRLDDAEQAYRRAIKLDPRSPYPWNGLGNLLAVTGDRSDEAEQAYRTAIELDHAFAQAWNGLGNVLHSRPGRMEEAARAYRKAAELAPAFAPPWNGLGVLLQYGLGRPAEAEDAYRKAIAIAPGLAMGWHNLGSLLIQEENRRTDGIAALREAVRLEPANPHFQNGLAWPLYASRVDLAAAEEHARAALALESGELRIVHTLACVLAARDQWPEAATLARRFLSEGDESFLAGCWPEILLFFREAVRGGHAPDGLALLEEAGLGERWRPLREALAAVASGSADYLLGVAPEARAPAGVILDELWPTEERPAPRKGRRA